MVSLSQLKPFDKIEIVRRCIGFTATQKLILFIISSHLGKNHFCFLSLSTLQKESGLSRATISDNLRMLIMTNVINKLPPGNGYLSNRYSINLEMLVVLDYQCSSLGLLDQSPRTTRVVVSDYPKRNINKIKEIKEEPSFFERQKSEEKAMQEIRKTLSGR